MESVRAEVTYSCLLSCLMPSSLLCPHHLPFPGVLCGDSSKRIPTWSHLFSIISFVLLLLLECGLCTSLGCPAALSMAPFYRTGSLGLSRPVADRPSPCSSPHPILEVLEKSVVQSDTNPRGSTPHNAFCLLYFSES